MENNTIDINESTVKNFIESLRPKDEEVRKMLDYNYSFNGTIVILYEIRPVWDNPSEILQTEFAKIRYYKSRKEWALYWKRANEKWELYIHDSQSNHLAQMLALIKDDRHGCFFG